MNPFELGLHGTIIECSWAASRTKVCFFSRFSYPLGMMKKVEQYVGQPIKNYYICSLIMKGGTRLGNEGGLYHTI